MNTRPIIIYTDGCCLGNPGKGGWAAILQTQGKEKELSGGVRLTTNNRMELLAVIKGLSALKTSCSDVTIYTDSQLISNAINEKWLYNWASKNWRKTDNNPVLNVDLWEQILELLKIHKVRFEWIEGHIGIQGNERCDVLCKNAAGNATDEDIDSVYEAK